METAVIFAMGAGARTQQSSMNTLLNRQTSQAEELKNIRDERIGEMLKAARNAEKAEKAGGLSKALGIFAMVASVLVTMGSMGTASPAGAALMVVGTGLTMAVSIDSMAGGKMMEKLSGGNQWVALALSIGISLGGAAMTMKGAHMISQAMKAKTIAQSATSGQAAAQATGATARTASQAGSTAAAGAKGSQVVAGGAKSSSAAAQTAQQSNQMLTGSMIERLMRMGSGSKNFYLVSNRTQQVQLRAAQFEATTDVASSVAGVPVAVHSYRASEARAKTKDLKADSVFVEARISQIRDYIQTASQQLVKNYEGMANVVAGLRNANASVFN
jgi:hypothetical protein